MGHELLVDSHDAEWAFPFREAYVGFVQGQLVELYLLRQLGPGHLLLIATILILKSLIIITLLPPIQKILTPPPTALRRMHEHRPLMHPLDLIILIILDQNIIPGLEQGLLLLLLLPLVLLFQHRLHPQTLLRHGVFGLFLEFGCSVGGVNAASACELELQLGDGAVDE